MDLTGTVCFCNCKFFCRKENVVAETQGMIPDTKSRLSNAVDDLNSFMVCCSRIKSLPLRSTTLFRRDILSTVLPRILCMAIQ